MWSAENNNIFVCMKIFTQITYCILLCTDEGKVFCWGWNKYGQVLQFNLLPDLNSVKLCRQFVFL